MDTSKVTRVLDLRKALPKRGHEPLKQLLYTELNYDRADELAAMDELPQSQRNCLAEPPRTIATASQLFDRFDLIQVTLSEEAPRGRGFPLSITAERAIPAPAGQPPPRPARILRRRAAPLAPDERPRHSLPRQRPAPSRPSALRRRPNDAALAMPAVIRSEECRECRHTWTMQQLPQCAPRGSRR